MLVVTQEVLHIAVTISWDLKPGWCGILFRFLTKACELVYTVLSGIFSAIMTKGVSVNS